jgi:hypothetical protein
MLRRKTQFISPFSSCFFRAIFFYNFVETTLLPGKWETKLTPFQRLLVLKCFREEKLIFAFPDFITATLDKDFIELPQFDLARAFTDTSHKTPLIFILSTGADPTSYPSPFLYIKNAHFLK